MLRAARQPLLWIVSCFLSSSLLAVQSTYDVGMNKANWEVSSDVFQCRLFQNIPYFGKAIFERKAGNSQRFYFEIKGARLDVEGKWRLVSQGPVWQRSNESLLARIDVAPYPESLETSAPLSSAMLLDLSKGRELVFQTEGQTLLNISLSPINFQRPYREFVDCLSVLLPVNYSQIKRTRLKFASGDWQLTKVYLHRLYEMSLYLKHDKSIKVIYIDGHADAHGKQADNETLSMKRAEYVADELIRLGIKEERLIVRWHGERYPSSLKQLDDNRRVTLRLEYVKDKVDIDAL